LLRTIRRRRGELLKLPADRGQQLVVFHLPNRAGNMSRSDLRSVTQKSSGGRWNFATHAPPNRFGVQVEGPKRPRTADVTVRLNF
jgi:hypothetical protein